MSLWLLTYQDIIFQTDIARDFLLIEDIVYKNHLTLLGPRSGGIPGVFHGPLWLYMQVPAFILAHGDPAKLSVFWFLLCMVGLYIAYLVAKKIFGSDVALTSTFLISCTIPTTLLSLFNPYGAVILVPFFFYFFYQYMQSRSGKYLTISLFLLGVIIQFQMAWGIPVLVLTVPLVVKRAMQTRKWSSLCSYTVLAIPLLTYFIFELRHSFLQLTSVIHHVIGGNKGYGVTSISTFFISRLTGMCVDGWYLLGNMHGIVSVILVCGVMWTIYRSWRIFPSNIKVFYKLFIYFYVGFWIISFLFRGVIWGYYYWPFLNLTSIALGILSVQKYKWLPIIIVVIIGFSYLNTNLKYINDFKYFSGNDQSSWKFNQKVAQTVFSENQKIFGYYVFTPDQYGFAIKYAMKYIQRFASTSLSTPYQKQRVVYLFIAPAPDYRPELNGDWWKSDQVRIKRPADFRTTYPNGLKIEKYNLSEEEVAVSSDPDLIQDLHFR
jgi:hypothetical protein